MESGGGGHAARVGDQPDPCQCVPPLRRRPLGPPVAKTSGSRAGDRLQVRGRYGPRLPVWDGWEATPRGPQGKAGAVRPVAPRGQDPADRVRAVRRPQPSRRWAETPGDVRLSGLHALLRQDQGEQIHGQAEDASQALGPKAEGNPRRDATPHARSRAGATSVAASSADRSLSVLRRDLQLSIIALVQGMRRKVLAQDARQPQPKGPHELGDLPPAPHRLPPPGTGDPPGMAEMIDSPRVLSEEPTAVTPHGGICGGESQQWLSYPTNLHVRFDERGVETELRLPDDWNRCSAHLPGAHFHGRNAIFPVRPGCMLARAASAASSKGKAFSIVSFSAPVAARCTRSAIARGISARRGPLPSLAAQNPLMVACLKMRSPGVMIIGWLAIAPKV